MKNLFSLSDNALFSAVRGNSDGDGLCFSQVGKGLLVAGVLLALCSLALAAVYCYTSLSGVTAHLLQLLVLAVAVFVGGFSAARGAGRKGVWHGLLLAVRMLALLLLAAFSGLTAGGVTLLALLGKGLVLVLAGSLGGILGVA